MDQTEIENKRGNKKTQKKMFWKSQKSLWKQEEAERIPFYVHEDTENYKKNKI